MNARKIMTAPVTTISPTATVLELARVMADKKISGVPVVDNTGKLVGIVTEADLMRRHEISTERKRPWWLQIFTGESVLADEYIRARTRRVLDIATTDVVTTRPNDSIRHLVDLMEKHSVKRIPILEYDRVVGMVSRHDLVRAFAQFHGVKEIEFNDGHIRNVLVADLEHQPWAHLNLININVKNGVVELTGLVRTDMERNAIRVAAESISGVQQVVDHMVNKDTIHGL